MSEEKLPLELLKEKYIPVSEFPERYGISVPRIMELINSKRIRVAEFRVAGERRRTLHVNYEEVLEILGSNSEV